ncbi:hypothetical protein ACFP56_04275 [Paenibacillus septentrionalis]|uniref:Uncharacterized protein n=1 Tax=Paenibacillus septentrionalis TaxID=429342 RepID=A0ABW1UZD1_9BACL
MKKIIVILFLLLSSCSANTSTVLNSIPNPNESNHTQSPELEINLNEELPSPFTAEAVADALVEHINFYSYYYPEDSTTALYLASTNQHARVELRAYNQPIYQNGYEVPVLYGVDQVSDYVISFYYHPVSKQIYVDSIAEPQNIPFLDAAMPYDTLGRIEVDITEATFPFTEEISEYKARKIEAIKDAVQRTFGVLQQDYPDIDFTIKVTNFLEHQQEAWMLIEGSNGLKMYALLVMDEYFYPVDDQAKEYDYNVEINVTRGNLMELSLEEAWFNRQLEADAYYFKKIFLEDPPLIVMESTCCI